MAVANLLITPKNAPIAVKKLNPRRVATYKRNIRTNVRGLWSGVLSRSQTRDSFVSTINRGLRQAWQLGAAECDIKPEDLTIEENEALEERITEEIKQLNGFISVIQSGSKANGGKLAPLLTRAELWANRYQDVFNQAQIMACKDQKLEWLIGIVEKHCRTCLALNGKVKRASQWLKARVRPQNPPNARLVCGGWHCDCSLVKTSKPVSKGPLPR